MAGLRRRSLGTCVPRPRSTSACNLDDPRHFCPHVDALGLLDRSVDALGLSVRAYVKCLRVARTITYVRKARTLRMSGTFEVSAPSAHHTVCRLSVLTLLTVGAFQSRMGH